MAEINELIFVAIFLYKWRKDLSEAIVCAGCF